MTEVKNNMWWYSSVSFDKKSSARKTLIEKVKKLHIQEIIVDLDKLCDAIDLLLKFQVPEREQSFVIDISGFNEDDKGAVNISIIHFEKSLTQ